MHNHLEALLALASLAAVNIRFACGNAGAPECPCLSSTSANWSQAVAAVQGFSSALGVNTSYGLNGCQAYDQGVDSWFAECAGADAIEFCEYHWCYIDEVECAIASMCTGSEIEPECRDRPSVQTGSYPEYSSYPLRYSYETCGFRDSYSAGAIHEESIEVTFALTAMTSRPWSFTDEATEGAIGILPDLVTAAIPRLDSNYLYREGVSEASLSAYTSSWDACVHDIGVGYTDVCLGDFWVTQERLLHCSFLPSVYQDNFWLVVKKAEDDDLLGYMEKPFAPFTWWLWLLVVVFLLVSGLLLAFAEHGRNNTDFPDQRSFCTALKGVYISFMSYFSGGPINGPLTLSGRLISMGIAFFVLIALASYTANLATFLIQKQFAEGINSLDEALSKGMTVAMSSLPYELLKPKYSQLEMPGTTIVVPFGKEAKTVFSGEADVAVIADSTVANMYAGYTVLADCESGPPPGEGRADYEKYCPQNEDGGLDTFRDCGLETKGKSLASVNVAVPVAKKHQAALAWALEAVLAEGYYGIVTNRYSAYIASDHPICQTSTVDESEALGPMEMLGSLIVSVMLVGTGFVLSILRRVGAKVDEKVRISESIQKIPSLRSLSSKQGDDMQAIERGAVSDSPRDGGTDSLGMSSPRAPNVKDLQLTIDHLEAQLKEVQAELDHARSLDKVMMYNTRLQDELVQAKVQLQAVVSQPAPEHNELRQLVHQMQSVVPALKAEWQRSHLAAQDLSVSRAAGELDLDEIHERISLVNSSLQDVAEAQWRLGLRVEELSANDGSVANPKRHDVAH